MCPGRESNPPPFLCIVRCFDQPSHLAGARDVLVGGSGGLLFGAAGQEGAGHVEDPAGGPCEVGTALPRVPWHLVLYHDARHRLSATRGIVLWVCARAVPPAAPGRILDSGWDVALSYQLGDHRVGPWTPPHFRFSSVKWSSWVCAARVGDDTCPTPCMAPEPRATEVWPWRCCWGLGVMV